MPKLERLIALARLKQGGEQMSVRELSQMCGVSQRTLYRYLNTLAELGPLPELAAQPDRRDGRPDSSGWTGDEANLLRYALDNNPLVGYPHFARRFRKLSRKLGLGRSRPAGSEVYQFKPIRLAIAPSAGDGRLDRFGKACAEQRQVKIQFRGRGGRALTMWPRGILVKGDLVSIAVATTEQGRLQELQLDQIHKIELCRGRPAGGTRRYNRKKG